jgi:hypothetical protein
MLKLLFANQLEEYEFKNSNNNLNRDNDHYIDYNYNNYNNYNNNNNDNSEWGFFVDLESSQPPIPFQKIEISKYKPHLKTIIEEQLRLPPVKPQKMTKHEYPQKNDDYSIIAHFSLITCITTIAFIVLVYI